jgi:hypothetical protein
MKRLIGTEVAGWVLYDFADSLVPYHTQTINLLWYSEPLSCGLKVEYKF